MNVNTHLGSTLLALVVLAALPVSAGENVDRELAASPDGVVEINNVRGEVRVEGWDRDAVQVRGELDDLAEGLEFTVDQKLTLVHVRMPDRDINRGDGSDLTVRVPAGSRVEVSGVSTDFEIESIGGGLEVQTVSGDVDARSVTGQVFVRSVSGDIDLADGSGPTSIRTVSGDTVARIKAAEFNYSGVSGDADIVLGAVSSLQIESVNGDVAVATSLSEKGRIQVKTINGDLVLLLRGEINARVDAGTGPGGDIVNGLNDTPPEESFASAYRLSLTLGDGSGSIRAKTVNGDIELVRD
jgi:hypothetical protein